MSTSKGSAYPVICPGGGLILAWQLKGKKVLLVGGGNVAAGEKDPFPCIDSLAELVIVRSSDQCERCRCSSDSHVSIGRLRFRDEISYL